MYAQTQDIINAIGSDKYNLMTNSNAANAQIALEVASGQIEALLARRYILPVTTQNSHAAAALKRVAVWLAIYQLINDAALKDDTIYEQYRQSIKFLQEAAEGTLNIVGAKIRDDSVSPIGKNSVLFASQKRIFAQNADIEFSLNEKISD